MRDRILWNRRPKDNRDCGDIDEVVMTDVAVHIEQMNDRCWWIGIYKNDGKGDSPYWMGNFSCDSRGRMTFGEQENYGIEWEADSSHNDPAAVSLPVEEQQP